MLSAVAGSEDVVRIGWTCEAMAWRRQTSASEAALPVAIIVGDIIAQSED